MTQIRQIITDNETKIRENHKDLRSLRSIKKFVVRPIALFLPCINFFVFLFHYYLLCTTIKT